MSARIVARPDIDDAISDFLDRLSVCSAAVVFEGVAGIGKTTVWLRAVERARRRGFTVLRAQGSQTESMLALGAVADVLGDVEAPAWAELPAPQRQAIVRVLLLSTEGGGETDQRALAAGLLAVIGRLARQAPVLLAIDDLQWLDPSSAHVIASVARRARYWVR